MSVIEGGLVEVRNELYVARWLEDDLRWGVGDIQPQERYAHAEAQQRLARVVVGSLTEVDPSEKAYSSCTDGRSPTELYNGEPVPVREQEVGTDTMLAFHIAESLGEAFYAAIGVAPNAPVHVRFNAVVEYLADNNRKPGTHGDCGLAKGYLAVRHNLKDFTVQDAFHARQEALLPEGLYRPAYRQPLTADYRNTTESRYEGWSAALVMDAVRRVSGDRAIARLNDDGRGPKGNGHVEEQIARVKVDGVAIDEAMVVRRTGGREVFGVNDQRMEVMARLMSMDNPLFYILAMMAAEDLTDGTHGTLAKGLPTLVIEPA